MAAARRESESGYLIATIVFFVLFIVAAGLAVWIYRDVSAVRKAVAQNQQAFGETVIAVFSEEGWQYAEQSPDQYQISYTQETFQDVAAKLQEASAYENEVRPVMGWESVEGMRTALQESPAQQTDGAPYDDVAALLTFYEKAYGDLNQQVEQLRRQNSTLTEQTRQLKDQLAQREQELQEKLNQAQQEFNSSLQEMRQDYQEVVSNFDRQREETQSWQEKYQQEVNQRKQRVAELQDEVEGLQQKVRDLITPGEEEELTADGEVIEVMGPYQTVLIEGGEDRQYQEGDEFVVYSLAPDGSERRKGTVRIGQVHDITSRANILREQEVILQGDRFVTTEKWRQFHPQMAREG